MLEHLLSNRMQQRFLLYLGFAHDSDKILRIFSTLVYYSNAGFLVRTLAILVLGQKSPYPTVVIVIALHHIEAGID